MNKNLGNTIFNSDTKINPNSELILLIYADFTSMPHDHKFVIIYILPQVIV